MREGNGGLLTRRDVFYKYKIRRVLYPKEQGIIADRRCQLYGETECVMARQELKIVVLKVEIRGKAEWVTSVMMGDSGLRQSAPGLASHENADYTSMWRDWMSVTGAES